MSTPEKLDDNKKGITFSSTIDKKIAAHGLRVEIVKRGDFTVVRLIGDEFRRSETLMSNEIKRLEAKIVWAKQGLFNRYIIEKRLAKEKLYDKEV